MCTGLVPDIAYGAGAQDAAVPDGSSTVNVLGGTTFAAVLIENVNSSFNTIGETILLNSTDEVVVNGRVAIAKGALIKAQVSSVGQRGMVGKGGALSFSPVNVQSVDGQWLSLDKDQLGAAGDSASGGMIFAVGLFAKGKAAFVPRGTTYQLSIRRDAQVDTSQPTPPQTLPSADLQVTATVGELPRVNFSTGKRGDDIVFRLNFSPDVASLVGSAPDSVQIIRMHDALLEPVSSILVTRDAKDKNVLNATFGWWSVIKHAQPGETPIVLQCRLSDGRVAQADFVMTTEWKLD
jgi:hypothetical protein